MAAIPDELPEERLRYMAEMASKDKWLEKLVKVAFIPRHLDGLGLSGYNGKIIGFTENRV